MSITPTKPLTPTHIKGLLWLDAIARSTRQLGRTTVLCNARTANLTAQTAAFWAYLDRVVPGADWSGYTEREIGELYVRSHAEGARPTAEQLRPYLDRVESLGWTHPASRHLVGLWQRELDLLHVGEPDMAASRPLGLSTEAALGLLAERGLVVDHRRLGGPAYLDGTPWGMPLRQLVGEDGHANYLLPVLRELIPVVGRRDRVLLVFDRELARDYVLLDRVLTALGGAVNRLALGRVPLDGVVQSSRYGGWAGSTLGELSRACLEHVDPPTYRLGMRIYFIAVLGRASPESFRPELLRRALVWARRMLRDTPEATAPDAAYLPVLRGLRTGGGHVDPYRLTTLLLGRRHPRLAWRLLRSVYL